MIKVNQKFLQEITITGPHVEKDVAIDYCRYYGHTIRQSGPQTSGKNKKYRFKMIAYRELSKEEFKTIAEDLK